MSIRLRLMLWHTGLLGLVLVLGAIVVYVVVARQWTEHLDHAIESRALGVSRLMQAVVMARSSADLDELIGLPGVREGGANDLFVQVVAPDGGLILAPADLGQPLPIPAETLSAALTGRAEATTIDLPPRRLKVYNTPLLLGDQVVAVLQVAASLQPLEASLARLRLVLVAIVLGVLVLAAALGWFLASQAMRPVDRITRAAHAIGRSTDFSRRLPEAQRRDELGRLTVTFNEMLDRLAEAVDTQRRFLADASHELRTPLTVVRTNAELALHGDEAATRASGLRTIARETDRMGRLVADLLVLARADAGQPLVRGRVALDRLLLEVYHQQRSLTSEVRLDLGALEQIEIDGDADRLQQLLLNLVDNALRHTPAGGTVTLDLSRRVGWAVVRVADTGAGISAEHLPHIFERFYRVDRTRSRGDRADRGSGLGLAICQWVTDAHGGRIEVESRVGVGSTFSVVLPGLDAAGPPTVEAAHVAIR